MKCARAMTLAGLMCLSLPLTAHASGGHASDPPLHVDKSVDDCSVGFAANLTQPAFARFTREFGSVSAFKTMSPPTTLGKWGVSIGVEQIYFSVEEHAAAWNDTFVHPDAKHDLGSDLNFPKLHVQVGLTDDLDVGAYFTARPGANYGWLGVEGKYALLKQKDEMPVSLALRAAYTKTLFVEDMDMHALGADVTVGRTFWGVATPYVGLGSNLVLARETTSAVELDNELQLAPHALGGLSFQLWHARVGAELELSALTSFDVQVGAVF